MKEPKKNQGYWDCPKCGAGYKYKGAAKKCCKSHPMDMTEEDRRKLAEG